MKTTSHSTVELLDSMGSDLSICRSAMVSFDKNTEWVQDESGIKTLTEGDTKLLHYLAKHNHFSPFCHATLQLRVTAPIFVARQLVKHQVGLSWNEVSRRYVDEEPVIFCPESWRARPDGSIKQGSGKTHHDSAIWESEYYKDMEHIIGLYNTMISEGVAPEQARMLLPQAMMTSWIWTGSLMAFRRVYDLRIDTHAQAETQEVAQLIGEHCYKLFPKAWEAMEAMG